MKKYYWRGFGGRPLAPPLGIERHAMFQIQMYTYESGVLHSNGRFLKNSHNLSKFKTRVENKFTQRGSHRDKTFAKMQRSKILSFGIG